MENQTTTKFQNPLSYLKIFFRRKWLFLAPLFAGLTIGAVAFFLVPPKYESYTLILIEEQRTINPLIQDLAVATGMEQRLRTIRDQILGWNNLADLAKKLNLDKKIENQLQYEEMIKDLRKKIEVRMTSNNIIRLSYVSNDPQEALEVTKMLSSIFIEENFKAQSKETDLAIDFLKEQLQVYKRKIKESEINELENQLKKLEVDSTEQHPMVKELRQKLALAKKELESGEFKVDEPVKADTDAVRKVLKQELDKISNSQSLGGADSLDGIEKENTDASIYKLFLMDKLDSAQARDINVDQKIYDMMLQRLETAKITQRLEASKQGTRYNIIDPARLPLKPIKPRILWILIGLFCGGGVGVGGVLFREFMDQSFLDIEDAKQELELPILGAISKITTQEEIINDRNRQLSWLALGVFFCAGIIIAAGLFSFFKK